MRKLLLALLLLILLPGLSEAYIDNLATCSQSAVQSALNARTDGDTIVCPSGTWSWTSQVSWPNKNITLQGAGIDQTIITVDQPSVPAIYWGSSNSVGWRITGFTFHSRVLIGEDRGDGIFRILGSKNWRVDHTKFLVYSDRTNWDGGNAIVARNGAVGLVDHNILRPSPNSTGCMHSFVYTLNDTSPSPTWNRPSTIGDAANVPTWVMVIEDNDIRETGNSHYGVTSCYNHSGHTVDAGGGFYIFRHNIVYNMNTDAHGFGENIATREYDISYNDFYFTDPDASWAVMEIRGGTGVIHSNTIHNETGFYPQDAGIWLIEYRVSGGNGGASQYGTSANSTCSSYPCIGQIGRGQDAGYALPQSQDPLYIWNNTGQFRTGDTSAGNGYGVYYNDSSSSSYIVKDRDFYLNAGAKPGYSAYSYPDPRITQSGDTEPPERSDSTPGSLPAGTTQYSLALTTNEAATCRYSTSSGISYSSMVNTFAGAGTTSHSLYLGEVTYSDNFNRANEDPLGNSVWVTTGTSVNDMAIVSNKVQGTVNSARNSAYYGGGVFAADQSSELTVSGPGIGPVVRSQSGATEMNGYVTRGTISTDPVGTGYLALIRYDLSGGDIWLASTANTVSDGDTLKVQAEGNSISVYKNDTLIPALTTVDTTFVNGYPGIYAWPNTVTGDDWVGAGLNSLEDGTTYDFYIRCQDASPNLNVNTDDYLISFTIQSSPSGGGGGEAKVPGIPTGVHFRGQFR